MTKEKIVGKFRLALNGVFTPFNMYGLDVFIAPAMKQVEKLAIKLHEDLKMVEAGDGSDKSNKT